MTRANSYSPEVRERAVRMLHEQEPSYSSVECFNRTVRHEWLDEYLFPSIEHVQQTATQWLWRYNAERPNMALGGITSYQKLAKAA